jgi:hypothetical protein
MTDKEMVIYFNELGVRTPEGRVFTVPSGFEPLRLRDCEAHHNKGTQLGALLLVLSFTFK